MDHEQRLASDRGSYKNKKKQKQNTKKKTKALEVCTRQKSFFLSWLFSLFPKNCINQNTSYSALDSLLRSNVLIEKAKNSKWIIV